MTTWAAAGLAAIYTFLTLSSIPYGPFLSDLDPVKLLKIVIVIYYFSWVFGVRYDTDFQEVVYATAPAGGKLRATDAFMIFVIFAVSIILLWSIDSERNFAVFLGVFLAFNILGWRYLLSVIRPIISESDDLYKAFPTDYFSIERLRCVEHYICGRWQWNRFASMGIVLIILNAVTFLPQLRQLASGYLGGLMAPLEANLIYMLLPDALFILFVVVAEGWMWNMRLKTAYQLDIANDLEERYTLRPREE
jgi:hypothetical protein